MDCLLNTPVQPYLCSMQRIQDDIQIRWLKLRIKLKEQYGIKPEMDGILFLIGVQELGTGKQERTKAGPDAHCDMHPVVAKWILFIGRI